MSRSSEIRAAMRALLAERGEKTACPSEVARRVAPDDWRPLMPAVRAVAAKLVESGEIEVTQRGRRVDLATVRGPIRLRARR